MRQFTSEQIQAQFEKLPKELQAAITSPEVNLTIRAVGDKHGLLIDQMGELVDIIGLIMLGLVPSKDFARIFSKESGVYNKEAESIAVDINAEVFNKIRSSMQEIEKEVESSTENRDASVSEIERAGGFTIDKETDATHADVHGSEREKVLTGIENPQTSAKKTESTPPQKPTYTDPLIDQLLSAPTARAEQKTVQKAPVAANLPPANLPIVEEKPIKIEQTPPAQLPKPPQPPQKSGSDMYRELIK